MEIRDKNAVLFSWEVGFIWDLRTLAYWPLALSPHLNLQMVIQQYSPLTQGYDTAQPRLFYLIRIHPGKAQGLHPYILQCRAFT